MAQDERLVGKGRAFASVHRERTGAVLVHNVAALNHKVLDDTVERNVHVLFGSAQLRKVVRGARRVFRVESNHNPSHKWVFQKVLLGNVQKDVRGYGHGLLWWVGLLCCIVRFGHVVRVVDVLINVGCKAHTSCVCFLFVIRSV